MVSLTAVEEALAGAFPEFGFRCEVAVLSKPDEDRGEALIAVTNEPKLRLDQIRVVLKEKRLFKFGRSPRRRALARNSQARHRENQSPRPAEVSLVERKS